MRLEPTPRPDQTLRVSARLITSSTILHLSSDELERAVTQEQMENPALEVSEQRICLFCSSPIQGPICTSCGNSAQFTQSAFSTTETAQYDELPSEPQWSDYHAYDIYDYHSTEVDDEDELDPLASIPVDQTLAETLLQQLEALVARDDALIAEQLVGNLNERGYLEISVAEIAENLEV